LEKTDDCTNESSPKSIHFETLSKSFSFCHIEKGYHKKVFARKDYPLPSYGFNIRTIKVANVMHIERNPVKTA